MSGDAKFALAGAVRAFALYAAPHALVRRRLARATVLDALYGAVFVGTARALLGNGKNRGRGRRRLDALLGNRAAMRRATAGALAAALALLLVDRGLRQVRLHYSTQIHTHRVVCTYSLFTIAFVVPLCSGVCRARHCARRCCQRFCLCAPPVRGCQRTRYGAASASII